MNIENERDFNNKQPNSVPTTKKNQDSFLPDANGVDLFKSVLRNQEELLVRFSTSGEITYINQAFSEMAGISRQKLLGRKISTIFSRRLLPNLHRAIENILTNPRRTTLDEYTYLNNGHYRWIQWVGNPIFNEQQELVEIQASGRDITDLKRSEETIRVQRDLALLLNESDEPTKSYEKLYQILCSLSAFTLFVQYMYEPNEETLVLRNKQCIGKSLVDFPSRVLLDSTLGNLLNRTEITYCSSDSPQLLDSSINLPASIKSLAILPVCYKHQTIATFILGSPEYCCLPDETKEQLLSIYKQLENFIVQLYTKSLLLKHENDLFALFKSLDQMLLVIDENGEIRDANRSVTEYILRKDKSASDKSLQIYDLHPSKDRSKILSALAELKRDRHSCVQLSLFGNSKQKIDVDINFTYCIWDGKERIIASYKDISEQIRLQEMEREQGKFTSQLVDIASLLNSSLELDVVYDHILKSIDQVIPAKACNILFRDGNIGRVIRYRGYNQMGTAEVLSSRTFELQKISTFAQVLESNHELCIPDVQNYPGWKPMPESFWVRSYVCAPIVIKGQIYGFLNCDSNIANAFQEKHAHRLKMVADQAAIAIENATVYSDTKHRLKQIALINELTQSMLESQQMGDVLLTLPQKILSVFDANSLMITKWESEKGNTTKIATSGEGILPNTPVSFPPGEFGLTEMVLKQKSPLVISTDEEYATWKKFLSQIFSDRIFLILPMINQDDPLGAILIGFKNARQITPAEVSIGEYVALQIAAIIHKSNEYEKAKIQTAQFQHANDLIASLSFVATSILSTKGVDDIIHTMGTGLEKMNIHSLLFFWENDSPYLSIEFCSRNKELVELLKAMGYPSNDKIRLLIPKMTEFHNSLNHQQIVFIDDPTRLFKAVIPTKFGPFIGKFQDALEFRPETKSLLLPLIVERKTIGLLCLYGKDLQEIDLKAGEIFNSQISVALENAKLLAEVKWLAITDELTGINNRRGLFELGNREFSVSKRLNRPLTALMIDLDNFKEINDKYGHVIGDVTLREVAQLILTNIREIDIIGRYGGEEFVVLLTNSDLRSSLVVAERIRQAIENQEFMTEAGPIQVTVSIGIDELDSMTTDLEKLIKRADRALYIAKHNGRNQVSSLSG